MPTEQQTEILSDEQLKEIEARKWEWTYAEPHNQQAVRLTVPERDALCQTVRALKQANKELAADTVRLTNEGHRAHDRWQSELQQTEQRLKTITEDRNLLYTDNTALREQLVQVEKERETLQLLLTGAQKFNTELRTLVKDSHSHASSVASKIFALANAFKGRLVRESYKHGFVSAQGDAVKAIENTGIPEWPGSYYKPHFIKAVKAIVLVEPES